MKARASGEGGICHPLHAVRPPAPGTGACGISAGPKRRAARMRTKTPCKTGLSRGIDAGSAEAGGCLCLRGATKIPICRAFDGSDGTRTRDLRRDSSASRLAVDRR